MSSPSLTDIHAEGDILWPTVSMPVPLLMDRS